MFTGLYCVRISLIQKSNKIDFDRRVSKVANIAELRTCLINSHRPCCMPECKKESCQRQHVLNRWHSSLKQKRACCWALRGYQDPENRDQRRKLRSIIEPKHRCLVYTSKKKSHLFQICGKALLYLVATTSKQFGLCWHYGKQHPHGT